MLGWEFFITEQVAPGSPKTEIRRTVLARWMSGIGGTGWVSKLVEDGLASDLGGDGYPCRYLVPAGLLMRTLANGAPIHSGPLVVGDDYVLPAGWVGEAKIDLEAIKALDPSTLLLVEAWDQS